MELCVERERGQKQEIKFFKLYDRTSIDLAVDRNAQGLDWLTARSTDVAREKGTKWGRSTARLTDISNKSYNERGH